jgi:hypothetical protein
MDKGCATCAKINAEGNVAIVHAPFGADTEEIDDFVSDDDIKTYFRVDWSGDVDVLIESCDATDACNTTSDRMCVAAIVVSDEPSYHEGAIPNREEILSSLLQLGAFDPSLHGVLQPCKSIQNK